MAKTPRNDMPRQKPEVRRHNFDEVALGYTEELALAEASRCLDCKKPACVEGCPVEIDIPGFIREIKRKNYAEAINILRQKNSLPAVCGRVCPQEEQCEKLCVLGRKSEEDRGSGFRTGGIDRRRRPRPPRLSSNAL